VIIFVGAAPSRVSDPAEPLSGRSGQRLASILGMSFDRLLLHARRNVNTRFPGRHKGADGFDLLEGLEQARILLSACREGDLVVLLGVNVARVFGFAYKPLAAFANPGGITFFILPHPSGLNRYWNKPSNRLIAQTLFSEHIKNTNNHE
jgi:uracil-DNA glycosylase